MTDEDFKKKLTPEQYKVLRQKGTEQAFTGKYYNEHSEGMYRCAACGAELFSSNAKFDSGTGWPSFDDSVAKDAVKLITDESHGMVRTEVTCANCGSHLGHVFNDGPAQTTGKRFCINSCSLELEPKKS